MAQSSYVRAEYRDGVAHAALLHEKLTEREAPIVVEEVCGAGPKGNWKLVIDLSQVTFLASAGIGAILTIHRRATEAGGAMAVHGLSDDVRDLLRLTRLHKLFPLAKSEAEAVKAVAG